MEKNPFLGFAVVQVDGQNSNVVGFGMQRLFDREGAKKLAEALTKDGKVYEAAALINMKWLEEKPKLRLCS